MATEEYMVGVVVNGSNMLRKITVGSYSMTLEGGVKLASKR